MTADDFLILHTGAANEQSARLIARLALATADDDQLIVLVAAIFQKAIFDAERGRADAVEFLDAACKDWRKRVNGQGGRFMRKRQEFAGKQQESNR